MGEAGEQDRSELARRSRGRKTRLTTFTAAAPTKWHPTSLRHPDDGEPFTGDGCWTFVADAIDRGERVEEMVLDHPPGKRGFVMKLAGHAGTIIYVKLQLLADKVLGRSFHESNGHEDEE